MSKFLYKPNVAFNGQPTIQQLICDKCKAEFGGAWRNDWESRPCDGYCDGRVRPILDEAFSRKIYVPSGVELN